MTETIKSDLLPFEIYSTFKDSPYSFFLDSALPSENLGKFSFLGIEPFLIFRSKKDRIEITEKTRKRRFRGNPFFVLKDLLRRYEIEKKDSPVPFTGGAAGYFSYDLKNFNERLPDLASDDLGVPDCFLCFYDSVLAYDHFRKEYFLVSTGFPEKGRRRLLRARARMEGLKNKIIGLCEAAAGGGEPKQPQREIDSSIAALHSRNDNIRLRSNFTKEQYIMAVKKAKRYIEKGDIYQVNLSQRFEAEIGEKDPFYLYAVLREINPAPFAAFLNFGGVKIVSSSPERFIKKDGSLVQTRPIKGTRPRHRDPSRDAELCEELKRSAKDRAENLMIIDLERNDLGRISEYGSVRVAEFMKTEQYATVHHLTSTIEGVLRTKITPVDCLMNCFPGGSITGAPKIRSMEIIEELEPVKRSVYTGSVGYIGFDGQMDTSIVIRTIVVRDGKAYFHVGGGIVYDSDPEREYRETLDKAKALIKAISMVKDKSEIRSTKSETIF